MIALAPDQAAPSLTKGIPSIRETDNFLLYAHPPLFQHVFAEIYDLLERIAIFAEFNGHAKCFSDKGSVRVINNRLREGSIIQCVRAMPRRKQRLWRTQIRVVVGVKKMLPGKYLCLPRLPNGLLFTIVKGALNLPDSFEGDRLGIREVGNE